MLLDQRIGGTPEKSRSEITPLSLGSGSISIGVATSTAQIQMSRIGSCIRLVKITECTVVGPVKRPVGKAPPDDYHEHPVDYICINNALIYSIGEVKATSKSRRWVYDLPTAGTWHRKTTLYVLVYCITDIAKLAFGSNQRFKVPRKIESRFFAGVSDRYRGLHILSLLGSFGKLGIDWSNPRPFAKLKSFFCVSECPIPDHDQNYSSDSQDLVRVGDVFSCPSPDFGARPAKPR
jgi:hypothetical protein